MKTIKLIFYGLFILCVNSFSQADFRPGYIINNSGDTIHGLIDYRGDILMSKICRFKKSGEDNIQTYSPLDLIGFRFENSKYFVSRTLESNESYFLEFLIYGKLNVYYYRDENKKDHYLIDNDSSPLKELPYKEEIKIDDDGKRVLTRSVAHIGLLKLYTMDAPEISISPKSLRQPTHQNLINIAEKYHNAVCTDESCIIYEKDAPVTSLSLRASYGRTNYFRQFYDLDYTNNFGVDVFLWLPRTHENLYFKTGLSYGWDNSDNLNYLIKLPTQVSYRYSRYNLKPGFYLGLSNYFIEAPIEYINNPENYDEHSALSYIFTPSFGLIVDYYFMNNVAISIDYGIEMNPILVETDSPETESGFKFIANSLVLGLRFDL